MLKLNFKRNKQSKVGEPPGTLIYSGEEKNTPVKITLIEYDEHSFTETKHDTAEDCLAAMKPGRTRWINVDGLHQLSCIERIGSAFNIHPLTQEDIVNTHQRPKFEDYDNYVAAFLQMLYYDNGIQGEQLSILLLKDTVISFQEVRGADAFDLIRNRLRQGKGRVRKMGADYLAYALLDAVVDTYFAILEQVGDRIQDLEEELIDKPGKLTMQKLHHMKREMIFLRKAVWPMRDLIGNMERSESDLIRETTDIYLRDVHDHTIRVIDTVETFRDLLSGMMDVYLSSVSNRMNEVMKVLTIITTLFVPVTFIAGVYGMNFDNMPELHTRNGYFIVCGVMIAIILCLLLYFKKRRWI